MNANLPLSLSESLTSGGTVAFRKAMKPTRIRHKPIFIATTVTAFFILGVAVIYLTLLGR